MRGLFDSGAPEGTTETASETLGRFLRTRREAIPGLRRQEVAVLDVAVHPPESTLTSIAGGRGGYNLGGSDFSRGGSRPGDGGGYYGWDGGMAWAPAPHYCVVCAQPNSYVGQGTYRLDTATLDLTPI